MVDRSIDKLESELISLRHALDEKNRQMARMEEDLRRARDESSALYMTSLDITSQLDLSQTLSSILQRVMLLTLADIGAVYLLDETSNSLIISSEVNLPQGYLGMRLLPGEDIAGEVLRLGQPVLLDDYTTYANISARFSKLTARAAVGLPLRWQGSIIGVLTLYHTTSDQTFTLDDLDSLQHITLQAAIAINNARMFSVERARNRRLSILYQAVTRITGSLTLDLVLQAASESLIEALNVTDCVIYERRSATQTRVLAAFTNRPFGRIEPFSRPEHLLPHLIHTMVNSGLWSVYQRDDPFCHPEVASFLDRHEAHSLLSVPVQLGQRIIGIVELTDHRAPRRFSMSDIDIVQALAAHIGVAIRHAQLHAESQEQRSYEQTILLKLARLLLETTAIRQVADRAVGVAAEAFNVQHVVLFLVDPSGGSLIPFSTLGWDLSTLKEAAWKPGYDSGVGFAALSREIIMIEDVFTETRFRANSMMTRYGLRSGLVAPMSYGEQLIGLMGVFRAEPRAFTADESRLLSLMAYQTVVAMERGRLFEEAEQYSEMLEARIDDRVREIRAQQERTEAILQAAGEALIVLDQKGCIQRVNPAFESQFQSIGTEVIGKQIQDILGVDIHQIFPESSQEMIFRKDFVFTRSNGEHFDAAVTLSRMLDSSGSPVGTVISIRDISDLKELDRMKDRFISSVSHELRTPLANIKLYQHLMVRGYEDRREYYFEILERETERLQRLIEDLLLLSRLDSDRILLKMGPLDVNEFIGTLVQDRTALINSRGLEITCDLSEEPLITQADEHLLNQAVTNLLANATHYTPSGGAIHVRTQLKPVDGTPMIIISVADTGLGLSPEDQERLFERFYRGSAAQTSGSAGTGLGMSIVSEIMEKLKGYITFDSAQGRGSTFYLWLPTQ